MESAVLISIKPEWCEKILNGKKTVEIRKTFPHDHMPFKCYIYCTNPNTKDPNKLLEIHSDDKIYKANGKVIGEFVCDRFDWIQKRGFGHNFDYCYCSLNEWGNDDIESGIMAVKRSCVEKDELNKYGENVLGLYCWRISNLKIYDRPKELREFTKYNKDCYFDGLPLARPESCSNCDMCRATRAPQSWMYVEELEE